MTNPISPQLSRRKPSNIVPAFAAGARTAYDQRYARDLLRVEGLLPRDAHWVDCHCHLESILYRTWRGGQKPQVMNNESPMELEDLVASWPSGLDGCITNIVFQRLSETWGKLSEWDWLDETLPLLQPGTPLGDKIWFTIGLHPSNANLWSREVEEKTRVLSRHPRCVGIGECGLDFSYQAAPAEAETQLHAFRAQASLAVELGKALVIHSRRSEHLLFQVMCEILPADHPIHVHCYTDSIDQAMQLCEVWSNLKIGFTGCVTFGSEQPPGDTKMVHGQRRMFHRGPSDKPEHFVALLGMLPISRILIETDGPYMCPEPFRGQTSHPGHVHRVAERIAKVKNLDLATVFAETRENCRSVYGI